jgi:ABC-type uncharacterized transport system permease subunit
MTSGPCLAAPQVQAGVSPYLGTAAAVLTGALLGYFVRALVVYFRLSDRSPGRAK